MYCSPHQVPPTVIPQPLRDRLGALLRGPARAPLRVSRPLGVFALGRIGDFVLSLSAIRVLVAHFGPANTVLLVPQPLQFLAEREFPGVACLGLPTEAASLTREILPIWRCYRPRLAGHRFDHRVCLSHQRSLYYELALSWTVAGTDHRLTPETYPAEATADMGTELLGHWRLVERVLGHPVTREEILPSFRSVPVADDGSLLVFPLSRDQVRRVPRPLLTAVLQNWSRRHRRRIVLAGGPAETDELQRLAAALALPDVRVEAPPGIPRLLTLIARAGAVFAGDSAAAHIATACDKPTVVVLGERLWGYCQPWSRSPRQKAFRQDARPGEIAAALPG